MYDTLRKILVCFALVSVVDLSERTVWVVEWQYLATGTDALSCLIWTLEAVVPPPDSQYHPADLDPTPLCQAVLQQQPAAPNPLVCNTYPCFITYFISSKCFMKVHHWTKIYTFPNLWLISYNVYMYVPRACACMSAHAYTHTGKYTYTHTYTMYNHAHIHMLRVKLRVTADHTLISALN